MEDRVRYLIGLIGSGIGASLSPALHEREASLLGLRYLYQLIDLDDLHLPASAAADLMRNAVLLGYRGLNITHPCKQLVLDHLDTLSADARAIGAVNTVVIRDGQAHGHNTDWSGFAEAFARGLPEATINTVALIGAGGAGAAVAYALRSLGTKQLTIVDPDPARAHGLVAKASEWEGMVCAVGGPEALAAVDGVVNASPVGMLGHPGLPIDPDLLRPSMWVADIVYRPLETQLLGIARGRGCRTLHGGGMAVCQAAAALRLFTGQRPDIDRMMAHLADLTGTELPSPPQR